MRKIPYYMAVVLLIIFIPVSRAAADTEEEATQENPQQPSTEEPTSEMEPVEEPTFESSTEEYTEEYYEEWTEETYDDVPPETEETYEEWTEESYEESYEPEPTVEQTMEPTVEEFTEEIIREPVEVPTEEPPVEMEPVEEPVNVEINQSEVTEFSIEGKVIADAKGVADVTVSLSGEKKDETTTGPEGAFEFSEVPAGDYTLEIDVPEGYEVDEASRTLTVEDRGKQGIVFDLSKKDEPKESALEAKEQVSADENLEAPERNMMLVIVGGALLILSLSVFLTRWMRNK